MEMRICLKCKVEKDISKFYKYKSRSGDLVYRNICKSCKNDQDRKSKKRSKIENKPVKKETSNSTPRINTSQNLKYEGYLNMSTEQREKLFLLIDKSEKILDMVDNFESDFSFENIEDENKVKKSITLSESAHNRILELCKVNNSSYSNIVDTLLKNMFQKW